MKAIVHLLGLFWHQYRWRFFGGILLSSATLLAGLALLGYSGWFIAAAALAGVAGSAAVFNVFGPAAVIRALALVRTGGRYGERMVTHDATLSFLVGLRRRLFDSFAHLDFARMGQLRSGEVLARITADVDSLDAVYLRLFVPWAAAILALVAAFAGLVWFNPLLAFGALGFVVFAFLVLARVGLVAARKPGRREALAREALRIRLIDLTQGLVELRFAGRVDAQGEAVLGADVAEHEAGRALNRLEVVANGAVMLGVQIGLGVALFGGAALVVAQQMNVAVLVLFVLVVMGLNEALVALVRGSVGFGRTELAATRLAPRLKAQSRAPAASRYFSPVAARASCLLRLDNVSAGWDPHGPPVVKNFSLDVAPGARIGIVGASGVGKTSLLLVAAGLVAPLCGQVALGPDVAPGKIAYLAQKSALFAGTIAQNLRLARPGASDEELWQALDLAELGQTVRALPHGLDTVLGERGSGLSGGQGRRLALARLIVMQPDVFILDEPTEGLGVVQGQSILAGLFGAFPQAGFIVATHRENERQLLDKLIAL